MDSTFLRRAARRTLARAVPASAALLLVTVVPAAARPRLEATFFAGKAWIGSTDLTLTVPGDTRLRFHDASFDDQSFRSPPYWGLRLTSWLPASPAWGVAVGYTHAKAVLDGGETVRVTGARQGEGVSGRAPVATLLPHFEMSHGLNLFTVEGLRRWRFGGGGGERRRRPEPFVGLGVGIAAPHVEAVVGSSRTFGYQLTGPVLEALAGVRWPLGRRWAMVTQGKLTRVDVAAELDGGGEIRLRPWLGELAAGVAVGF